MIQPIRTYCEGVVNEFHLIPEERKLLLKKIAVYISDKIKSQQPVRLVYICTHNSRRSHFGQIWAAVAAAWYGIEKVYTYSGGTEVTAFNTNAIHALKRIGFAVNQINKGSNPVYHIIYDEKSGPVVCFSKVYDHPDHPASGFAAIMTCSDAGENCPFVPGVELRIGTTYEDPKIFDGTPRQDEQYDERCRQIAREVFYMFSQVEH